MRRARRLVGLGAIALVGLVLPMACGSSKTSTQTPSGATGNWTGSLGSPGTIPVGVRFTLHEQNGKLTGRTYFEDPKTHELLADAELTGIREGANASWTTSTDLAVAGTFDGNAFTGKITFPADGNIAARAVDLNLNR